MSDPLQHVLAVLQYDARWLEYGLLDPALAEQQLEVYQTGGDPHPEHYRYAAFCAILTHRVHLDTLTLTHYLTLVEVDPDQAMAQAALTTLLRWNGLRDDQLAGLRVHPRCRTPYAQKVIEQVVLRRELTASGLTDSIFRRCLAVGDSELQRALIERTDVSRSQLAVLAEHGHSRAVRNLAVQQLRRRSNRRR